MEMRQEIAGENATQFDEWTAEVLTLETRAHEARERAEGRHHVQLDAPHIDRREDRKELEAIEAATDESWEQLAIQTEKILRELNLFCASVGAMTIQPSTIAREHRGDLLRAQAQFGEALDSAAAVAVAAKADQGRSRRLVQNMDRIGATWVKLASVAVAIVVLLIIIL
jgi:hypothetical protein